MSDLYPHGQVVKLEDYILGWSYGAAKCKKCGFSWLAVYNAHAYAQGNLLQCKCCRDVAGEIIDAFQS